MSLREIKEELDAQLRSSLGLRTLNGRTRQIAQLVPSWQQGRLETVPPVVRVDGIWVTLMEPTGVVRKDRLGRQREVKRARKVPILVAQGVWPATGQQEVVAWTLGRAEDEESWEQLLTQMWERGIRVERGLQLLVGDGAAGLTEARRTVYWDVPFQRCVFHKLRNVRRAIVVPEGVEGKAARAYKRRLIRSAARVWQAADVQEARRRQYVFCRRWGEEQPAVAATMRRDFEATLTFYDVQAAAVARGEAWPAHCLRTTSPLERLFRTFRKRFSQAVLFHSRSALAAVVHQLLARCAARRTGALPLSWQSAIERALADTNRIS
jgi:transposase-like protein